MLPSGSWVSRKPQVDLLALDAGGLLAAPVGGEDLPVEDHVGQALILGPVGGVVQVRGLVGERGVTSSR